jgi:alpha-galactosidase
MRRSLAITTLLLCGIAAAQPHSQRNSIAEARQWAAARFRAEAGTRAESPYMAVRLKRGAIERNRRRGVPFLVAGRKFEGGVALPSPGEVEVHLPAPATRFEAEAGVDSNDLGYYSNAGRGNVVLTVESGGRELARTAPMREGTPATPVSAGLAGARVFTIKLAAVGEHGPTHQAEWDQADLADARVTLSDGSRLRLADIPLGPPADAYPAEAPFSFVYDGQPSASLLAQWRVARSERALDAQRTEYTSIWTDPRTGLSVRCVGVAYADYPAVEWTLHFRNTGTAATPIIEKIQAIDTAFQRTPEGEFLLHHSKGSPNSPTDFQPLETPLPRAAGKLFVAKGGRPTDADMSYFNVAWTGHGVILAVGWPGQWAARFQRAGERSLHIAAGQELTHFRLLPGEEVRSPLMALLFWDGDWIAGQNQWRRWMVAHNLPRPGGKLPPPQLAGGSNRQTIEMQEATERNQKELLARTLASGLPIDYWWMDAGWYVYEKNWSKTGNWDPDPQRFPHGFTPVSAAAHARNVKTIVWFEPERVTAGSRLWNEHPEWLLGSEKKDKLLFLGNADARHWLIEHVSKMIEEQGIDLYRQDFNFEPLERWRSHDTEDRQGITEIQHITGYLAYWDELRRRFPNVMIDTCASGGRRDDLETLRRSVPLWRSDFAFEPAAMQQLTYGLMFWVPYFGTGFNSVDPYYFRSQMTPAVGVGMGLNQIEANREGLGRLLAQWRSVADLYYGDYYPLTPYSTSSTAWMAWQLDRPERNDGMVQAFRRPESPFAAARFPLRGLEAAARYLVTDVDTAVTTEHSGQELMEAGLPVNIGTRQVAVILRYRRK